MVYAKKKDGDVRGDPELDRLDWLERHQLDVVRSLYTGVLPAGLLPNASTMEDLWNLHPPPAEPSRVSTATAPCWQQAFGKPYGFSRALPVPQALEPLLAWVREKIDPRLNGLSLNWYDAALGHYMVLHRDNTKNLVTGAPIVTLSLGAERVFRLRPWWPGDLLELTATHGKFFVMPLETNRVWRHGVPHRSTDTGHRISVTFRAFKPLDGNRDERTAAAYQTASATK